MNRNEGKFFLLNFRSFFGFFFIVDRISVGVFTRTTPKAEINEKRRGSSKANDEPMACRNGAATRTAAGPPLPRRAVCHQKSSPDWSTATLSTTRHAAIIRRPSSFPFFFSFLFIIRFRFSRFGRLSGGRGIAFLGFFFVTEFLCSIVLDFFGRYSIRVVNAKPQPAIGASSLSPDDYRVFLLFFGVFFFLVLVLPWVSFFQGAHSDRDTGSSQSGRFQVSFLS